MLTWKLPNYSDSKSYTHTWNSYSWHYSYCCVPYSFLLLDCSSCYYCNPRGQKPFPIAKIHPFVVGFVVFTINWYVSWARRKFQRQGVQQQFVTTSKKSCFFTNSNYVWLLLLFLMGSNDMAIILPKNLLSILVLTHIEFGYYTVRNVLENKRNRWNIDKIDK